MGLMFQLEMSLVRAMGWIGLLVSLDRSIRVVSLRRPIGVVFELAMALECAIACSIGFVIHCSIRHFEVY